MEKLGPSERVTRILLSRGMAIAEIQMLTELQAWDLVYEKLPARRAPLKRLQVCFTGFESEERYEMESIAMAAGHNVARSVTKSLGLLVCGDNPGPAKLEKAHAQGVKILTAAEYRERVQEQNAASA